MTEKTNNWRQKHPVLVPEAQSGMASVAERFSKWVVQGYLPGQGVGAFVLRWRGQILAQFMHLRLHEVRLRVGRLTARAGGMRTLCGMPANVSRKCNGKVLL